MSLSALSAGTSLSRPREILRYTSQSHAKGLLKVLHRLYLSHEFCDVRVSVESQVFQVHKNVLSAASPYFHAMFAGGLAEQSKDTVHIQGIDSETFRMLLRFIYTGELEVTVETCQDLLMAADMLGLSEVMEACCNFLQQQLLPANCIGIYLFADAHSCVDLRAMAETYIHSHFPKVIEEEEYLDLPKEVLVKLLQSENLQVENEFQVFSAAMKWILHDAPARRRLVFEILNPIRFPIMSAKQLEKYIEDCPDLSLKIALRKLVQDFRTDRRLSDHPYEMKLSRIKPCLWQPRKCARKHIYAIGGYRRDPGGRWSDSQSLSTVEVFNSFHQNWRQIPALRHARSGHGVVVLGGLVYVIGGESDSLIYDNAECFDPASNKWSMIPCMTVPRCGLGVCAVRGRIFAIGGWVGSEIGNTMEAFDPKLNIWTQIGRVNTLRFAMGVAEHEGLIYVVGGMNDLGTEMSVVESYNPVTGEWVRLTDMCTKRAYLGLSVVYDAIYAVGGWNEDSGALSSIERYSIEDNKWTSMPAMSSARAGASTAVANGLLYVIGGRTSTCDEFTAPTTLDTVECFDPQLDSWFDLESMPSSRCEAGVAVL